MKTLLKVAKKSTPAEKARSKRWRMMNPGKVKRYQRKRKRKVRTGETVPRKRMGSPGAGYTFVKRGPSTSSARASKVTPIGQGKYNPAKNTGSSETRTKLKGK